MARIMLPKISKCIKLDLCNWVSLPWPRSFYLSKTNHVSCHFLLHRSVISEGNIEVIDHINHDPLDNRKENLRACTYQENSFNRLPIKEFKTGKSKNSRFKGVLWRPSRNKWESRISIPNEFYSNGRGKVKHIGTFETEKEAALAYNQVAKQLHGAFAYLNQVD